MSCGQQPRPGSACSPEILHSCWPLMSRSLLVFTTYRCWACGFPFSALISCQLPEGEACSVCVQGSSTVPAGHLSLEACTGFQMGRDGRMGPFCWTAGETLDLRSYCLSKSKALSYLLCFLLDLLFCKKYVRKLSSAGLPADARAGQAEAGSWGVSLWWARWGLKSPSQALVSDLETRPKHSVRSYDICLKSKEITRGLCSERGRQERDRGPR